MHTSRGPHRTSASGCKTLSIALGEGLPTEFRVFVSGWNETENGRFLFDDVAAKAVMAAYGRHEVDRMIDLEHLSLDSESRSFDPDARGWCHLELRNGELWAVNVTWTPDGAERLQQKRQRYVSPAFEIDPKTKRVTKIVNIALTALPATHGIPELVAARTATEGETNMLVKASLDPKLVQDALEALATGDTEKCAELLKGLIASAASGGEEAAPEDPAEEMAVDPEEEPEEEEQAAVMAATSRLIRLTEKTTIGDAVNEVEIWRASHIKLEAETVKLAKERAALELGQRKDNAIKLTKLGAETPHTTGLAKNKLCKRLLEEPLEEQNERVAALLAARGGKLPEAPQPPPGNASAGAGAGDLEIVTPHGTVTITAREKANCEKAGAKLETYAANKAIHLAAKARAKKAS